MEKIKPTIFILFGGTGDLARNKIFPAFMDLKNQNHLPPQYKVVGFSRRDISDTEYREFAKKSIDSREHNHPEEDINDFLSNIQYVQGDINDIDTYKKLGEYLQKIDEDLGTCSNKVFYLAVPPNLYESIFMNLDKAGLVLPCKKHDENTWTRILVEKPFGNNAESALRLDKLLGKLFDEEQIFRIDHYLAKEALQNIIFFRFANPIFQPIWNRDYIERIEIKLLETSDVSERGAFYDPIGALSDVGQNHIMQMIALITMEDPQGLTAEVLRKARASVLSKVVPASRDVKEFAFKGQYEGYQQEDGVAPDSDTETYFKLKLNINNKRFKGVPIIVESGKALDKRIAEIKIVLKEQESCVCPPHGICKYGNTITITIQPEEKIDIKFWTKRPGLSLGFVEQNLSFNYGDGEDTVPDAYEKVLFDCIVGDQTLFASTEEVLIQWNIIQKIKKAWKDLPLVKYKKGSSSESLSDLK